MIFLNLKEFVKKNVQIKSIYTIQTRSGILQDQDPLSYFTGTKQTPKKFKK